MKSASLRSMDQVLIERTGDSFDEAAILRARAKTWEAIHLIASRIQVGMAEEDGLAVANATLVELGAAKKWHRSWVRFGVNTLNQYGVPSVPGVVLQPDDIFFIDLGPIWDGYEGDAGKSFVVGQDPERLRCAQDSKSIYDCVRDRWLQGGETGATLYQYAVNEAESRGWKLTLHEANGHRLSDFPHALYFKGSIADLPFSPTAARWVLEIQLRHPSRPFGAFFEDLLV